MHNDGTMTGLEVYRSQYEPETTLKVGKGVLELTFIRPHGVQLEKNDSLLFVPGYVARRRCALLAARALAVNGHTSILMSHSGHTMDQAVKDISAVTQAVDEGEFLDYDIEPGSLTVLGHSLGAVRAMKSLADNPHGTKGFVPIAPAGLGGVKPWAAVQSIASEAEYMGSKLYVGEAKDVTLDALRVAFAAKWELPRLTFSTFLTSAREEAQKLYDNGLLKSAIMFPGDRLIDPRISAAALAEIGNIRQLVVEAEFTGHNTLIYHADKVAPLILDAVGAQQLEDAA